MSHGGGDEDGKLDLVPLIDTVMLLLMFFILTSKFTNEEKVISSLLPTDKGQMSSAPSKKVEEPKQVNICIYPTGMERGRQPSEYRQHLEAIRKLEPVISNATMRIGGNNFEMEGIAFPKKDSAATETTINELQKFVAENLGRYETPGAADRKDQVTVIIHCFSGMSWRYALLAYDAVRYYESKNATFKYTGRPEEMARMREVTFAPPRIRNYSLNELGNELFEIIHMK